MRSVAILVGVVLVLFVGGAITAGLVGIDLGLITTDVPEASVFEATPEQAMLLMVLVGIVLGSLIAIGGAIAFVMYRSDVALKRARNAPKPERRALTD
jgi:hypothetical protein